MKPKDFQTAEGAARAAENLNLTGPAADLYVKAGASSRHRRRVGETIEAARAWAAEWAAPFTDEGPSNQQLEIAAAFLIAVDLHGVGGPLSGAYGIGTPRLPELRHLGNGRWHAGDGPAWRSAAQQALRRLVGHNRLKIAVSGGWWHAELGKDWVDVPLSGIDPEWGIAVAATAITVERPVDWPEWEINLVVTENPDEWGSVEDWGEALNELVGAS